MSDLLPQALQSYLNGLDPMYRGVAETAVEIVNGYIGERLEAHGEAIKETSLRLNDHEARIKQLEERVKELEAERGVLCH